MRVCIDARSISHPRRGGFKTYIENLVTALAVVAGDHEFTVVYDRSYRLAALGSRPRFREVVVPAGLPFIGQLYREQVGLPSYARSNRPALWHFPYNTAPATGVADYVLTLHDVTAFTHTPRPDWSRPLLAAKELALYWYPRLLMRRSAHRARAIITVSNYARRQIVERLEVPAARVFVTPLAAQPLYRPLTEEEKAHAREVLSAEVGLQRPFLLTVASSLLKNPQGVVQSYARLPEELRARCDLVVVMAHERVRAVVEGLARRLGLATQFHVLVNLEPEKLRALYNLAEALVYPSFTESFPLPTAEAMACGTPIVCSNSTGFPEQVGEAGLLVEPADSNALTDAMATVISRPSLARQLREQSLDRSHQFSWPCTAQQTLAVYHWAAQKLLENR